MTEHTALYGGNGCTVPGGFGVVRSSIWKQSPTLCCAEGEPILSFLLQGEGDLQALYPLTHMFFLQSKPKVINFCFDCIRDCLWFDAKLENASKTTSSKLRKMSNGKRIKSTVWESRSSP